MQILPEHDPSESAESVRLKAEAALVGNSFDVVSLGGFGGYVTVGFDHTIANVAGSYDFKVRGNAFYDPTPDALEGKVGGSAEPGVIWVSYDANGNGLPDDEWYEIAGSESDNPLSTRDYSITYYRPDPNKEPVKDTSRPYVLDAEHVRWTDNQGNEGFIPSTRIHQQNHYPEWTEGDRLTFTGTRLPDNAFDIADNGKFYFLIAYDYGYADCHPNDNDRSNIKIDWAVDRNGNPAHLPGVDFIRIHTGIHQFNGQIGECSTEVAGIEDLHPEVMVSIDSNPAGSGDRIYPNPFVSELCVETEEGGAAEVFTLSGHRVYQTPVSIGRNVLDLSHLPSGVYLMRTGLSVRRIVKY